tara:strand:- start:248 stop:517 length:270 start_codon:yes stop_codon:yes gene_type:complete
MLKNIISILISLIIISFFYFVFFNYFSETNKNKITLKRLDTTKDISNEIKNLIVLDNDTENVIEFNYGYNEINKNENKRKFWNLIKNKK